MRVVVDTNILISALINPAGVPFTLYNLWNQKQFDLVTSTWQIEEVRDVTRRPHLKDDFKPHTAGRMINELRKSAFVLDELPEVDYSPDPKDNPVLVSGIAGQVQYIVSGDKRDMLELETVQGIPIVTARRFVGLFMDVD